MPLDLKWTDKLDWSIVLLSALLNLWISLLTTPCRSLFKFSSYPIVNLVGMFALTYRRFKFLRLTNIFSGNELIEFDCKYLWKNMTNLMGKKTDAQFSSQWLTIHLLYASVIADIVIVWWLHWACNFSERSKGFTFTSSSPFSHFKGRKQRERVK